MSQLFKINEETVCVSVCICRCVCVNRYLYMDSGQVSAQVTQKHDACRLLSSHSDSCDL